MVEIKTAQVVYKMGRIHTLIRNQIPVLALVILVIMHLIIHVINVIRLVIHVQTAQIKIAQDVYKMGRILSLIRYQIPVLALVILVIMHLIIRV